MIRLHQTFGVHAGRVVELDREVIRLGRLPDNDVAFDSHADLDASGRHAEIRREAGQWVLVDVGSRNGTHVAGRRITRHVLGSGDEIELGLGGPRLRVEFVAPSAAGSAGISAEAATPVALAPSPEPARPRPGASAPSANGFPMMPAGSGMPGAHAPTPPVDASFAPGPRYGQRTVGMMIQAAVHQAQQESGRGSTTFLRAVAVEAAQRSSRGLKLAVGLLAFLLLLTLGAVVAVFYYARWQEQDLRDENVRLQRDLAALGDRGEGESAERRRLEQRLSELNERLSQSHEADGTRIAEANDQAVYIVLTERSGRREVLCTAFAVRGDVLATTARCVGNIERAMGRDPGVSVVPNRGTAAPLRVRQMWRHPAFVDVQGPSPDVGLIRVDRALPQHVRMATMAELGALRTGEDVYLLGFPGVIAGSGAPVAVLSSGVVGRMTAFDGNETDPPRRHLISHSAPYDGNAGAPVFDREGRVVAMNAANFRTRTRVVDPGTRLARTVDAETNAAWAVRVDLILQLLAGLPAAR